MTNEEIQSELLSRYTSAGMLDTVQRWTAPYDGNIVIDVSFLAASVNAAPSPSIRAAVQINQAEQWAVVLGDEAQSKILSATVTGTLLIGIYFLILLIKLATAFTSALELQLTEVVARLISLQR